MSAEAAAGTTRPDRSALRASSIGRSDRDGGYVTDLPFTPDNYVVSVYEKPGIDRSRPVYTSSNRPMFIGDGFEPIRQLF
jgi:hypothetical protein